MDKIFFFDVDGTLAVGKNTPEDNKWALRELRNKGYLTFICSGRPPMYASKLYNDLVSGLICSNGRYILFDGKKLHGEEFSAIELKKYEDLLNGLGCPYLLHSDEVVVPVGLNDSELKDLYRMYGEENVSLNRDLPFYSFDIYYRGLEHRDYVMDKTKDILLFNDHGGYGHADIAFKDYDKGSGIEYCLKHFGIDRNNAYCFGDSFNDLPMFRVCDNRIAMGNAIDEIKQKATYVTSNVLDAGVCKALINLGVLER